MAAAVLLLSLNSQACSIIIFLLLEDSSGVTFNVVVSDKLQNAAAAHKQAKALIILP